MRLVRGKTLLAGAIAVCALVLITAACTNTSPLTPSVSPTAPSQTPAASSPPTCDQLLPVQDAGGLAGVSPASLTVTRSGADDRASVLAVGATMNDVARAAAGEIDCYRLRVGHPDQQPAGVQLSVLPGSSAAFGIVEPDTNDNLGGFQPVAVGDEGYVVCNGGESNSCRIDALSGETWFSIRVTPRPADTSRLTKFAQATAVLVRDALPASTSTTAVGCDALIDADALGALGLTNPTTDDNLALDHHAYIGVAAERDASIAGCSWTAPDSSRIVSVQAVPSGKTTEPTGAARSGLPLQPIAGSGESAVGGCRDGECEVDTISGGIWMSVHASAAVQADLPALEDLAHSLLGRITV